MRCVQTCWPTAILEKVLSPAPGAAAASPIAPDKVGRGVGHGELLGAPTPRGPGAPRAGSPHSTSACPPGRVHCLRELGSRRRGHAGVQSPRASEGRGLARRPPRPPLAAQPLRGPRSPGWAPRPCTQRRDRGRADSRGP